MIRFLQAFWTALQLTLRGETVRYPGERRYPELAAWIRTAETLFVAANQALNTLDDATRKGLRVQVDGRTLALETIIATVGYHLQQEYVYLLTRLDAHSLTVIYAANLNDRYALVRLLELDGLPEALRPSLTALRAHLDNIPSSQT